MKVRHKQHPDVMVDLDASTRAHWLAGLSKDAWELVPEDRWQDVTEACIAYINEDDRGHFLRHSGRILASMQDNYRLRKVQLLAPLEPVTHLQWAFVVERKVSE